MVRPLLSTLNDTHCTLCILTKTLNKLFFIYMEFIFTFTFQAYKFFKVEIPVICYNKNRRELFLM